MAGGKSSREFYIKCRGEECWEILEALLDNLKARDISYRVTDRGIWIRISGLDPEVKRLWSLAKRVAASTKSFTRTGRGVEIEIDALFKKLHATFPPQALEEALNLLGIPASIVEGRIRTAADPDTLLRVASLIAEASRSLPPSLRSSAARRMILAASAVLEIAPEELVERAEELGILAKDPDTGMFVLMREWRRGLRDLVKTLRRHASIDTG